MTDQFSDICVFDGRQWEVEESEGLSECIPTNDQLGFSTISPSTANWSGRIDHYLVYKDHLYLFKVEVELPAEHKDLIPPGARREVKIIYEPRTVHRADGVTHEEWIHERRYFVYDDWKLDYSGELLLLYPTGDIWEHPWPIKAEDLEPTLQATLSFEQGLLVDVDKREL